jgi:aerobic-type carbon monoxide dehydrogenase small subunit (CoxS/CutS family)
MRTRLIAQAWLYLDVMQCAYCQAGQLMSATALPERIPRPTERRIARAWRAMIPTI